MANSAIYQRLISAVAPNLVIIAKKRKSILAMPLNRICPALHRLVGKGLHLQCTKTVYKAARTLALTETAATIKGTG
ncbi:hypothetical protein [Rhizobium lusitanum]|uniref:Uncharacterized protein n=1 Tax=Rhizobium lusitanum TaxID=293958 RepID=A0A7X0IWW6_9HYPH|nr:hypothetical protein [Rhizobium lusitanum]MBB6488127.1 hypothetical protein [Rhizobium lusitanum]